jgi:3-oxoacyl-[acyl-carrier-protein] synthase III
MNAWTCSHAVSLLGSGTALPGPPMATETLIELQERRFGFTQGRAARAIAHRLGIDWRHLARDWTVIGEGTRPGDGNPDLAARAVAAALADAGMGIGDLGYLIGHTASPAQPLPSNIAMVADRLCHAGPHAEFRQACTGFANALAMAIGLLALPGARPVAIVGSETASPFFAPGAELAPGDIVNLVQMGDGAAAVILAPLTSGAARISHAWYGAIGLDRAPGLEMTAGGSACPQHRGPLPVQHRFGDVRVAGERLFSAHAGALDTLGLTLANTDVIVPHQANGRIAAPLAAHLGLDPARVFVQADQVGNTGSAAIWLAVDAARRRLVRGETLLALGAEATKHMFGGFRLVA